MIDNVTDSAAHPDFDHERTDVAPRWPVYIGIGMLLSLPLTVALIAALLHTIWAPPQHLVAGPRIELARPAPNAPRLQTHPQADLAKLQQQWERQLHSTGWIDRKARIVHVPIEQAKQRLVANGLPQDTRQPPPSRVAPPPGAAPGRTDRAGNGAARPARNHPQRTPAVPYRQDRMQP